MQVAMLPADQDISWAVVVVHDISHAVLVITAAGGINSDTEVLSERLNGLKWTLAGTI